MTFETLDQHLCQLSEFEEYTRDYYLKHGYTLPEEEIPSQFLHGFTSPPNDIRNILGIPLPPSGSMHFPLPPFFFEQQFFSEDMDIFIHRQPRYSGNVFQAHAFYEVCYLYRGECKFILRSQTQEETVQLTTGDFIFIPPLMQHAAYVESDAIILNIGLRSSTFARTFAHNIPDTSILGHFFSTLLDPKTPQLRYLTFHTKGDLALHQQVQSLCLNYCNHTLYAPNITNLQLTLLFLNLLQNYSYNAKLSTEGSVLAQRIPGILHYIEKNYSTVTIKGLAHEFGYSEDYLNTVFKSVTGQTLRDTIMSLKMKKAGALLKSSLPVHSISLMLGYKDTTNFIRNFKHHYGITPAQYRKKELGSSETSIL